MHICVSKLTIVGSDNGLSPGRHQVIIWTNAGIVLIGPLGTRFGEILNKIYISIFQKMHLKMSLGNWRPVDLGLSVANSVILWLTQILLLTELLTFAHSGIYSHYHSSTHLHIQCQVLTTLSLTVPAYWIALSFHQRNVWLSWCLGVFPRK